MTCPVCELLDAGEWAALATAARVLGHPLPHDDDCPNTVNARKMFPDMTQPKRRRWWQRQPRS